MSSFVTLSGGSSRPRVRRRSTSEQALFARFRQQVDWLAGVRPVQARSQVCAARLTSDAGVFCCDRVLLWRRCARRFVHARRPRRGDLRERPACRGGGEPDCHRTCSQCMPGKGTARTSAVSEMIAPMVTPAPMSRLHEHGSGRLHAEAAPAPQRPGAARMPVCVLRRRSARRRAPVARARSAWRNSRVAGTAPFSPRTGSTTIAQTSCVIASVSASRDRCRGKAHAGNERLEGRAVRQRVRRGQREAGAAVEAARERDDVAPLHAERAGANALTNLIAASMPSVPELQKNTRS